MYMLLTLQSKWNFQVCLLIGLSILFGTTLASPIVSHAKSKQIWRVSSVRINDLEALIIFEVTLDSSRYLYAQRQMGDCCLKFEFEKSTGYDLVGLVKEESNVLEEFEPYFQRKMKRFDCYASFTQRVKLNKSYTVIKGKIHSMTSSDGHQPSTEIIDLSVAASVGNRK